MSDKSEYIYMYTPYIYTHHTYNIYIYVYTSRWYARNYVRIVCHGGDHSKKVISVGMTTSEFGLVHCYV